MNDRVVLDTNILVSALLSPESGSAKALNLFLAGSTSLYFDSRILHEYERVLTDPKFPFDQGTVRNLMVLILEMGFSVTPEPFSGSMPDESDRKFVEVAIAADAALITGNMKHYPNGERAVSLSEYFRENEF
jgi:putative PIN family toxin of toxin-antitoxin system